MINENKELTYKKIFVFWYPLAASWLMMAVEGPFLAAVIARLAEPKFNLAAYGVAFSLALIVEAPIIMLMTASTALCKDRDAFSKLWRFTFVLNAGITASMLILLIPPVFYFVAEGLIELPHHVARLTHFSLVLLLPWPAAIGLRRFYQGILIRFNLTRRVAYGTGVRVTTMAGTALVLYLLKVTGAYVGAAALAMGVTCETIAVRLMVHGSMKQLRETPPSEENKKKPLTYGFITKFYYPLALMTLLSLGVHPMVTFFMGKARFAIESLAVLPVVNSLFFIFRSLGLSFQEVVIALMGKKKENYTRLRNFAFFIGAGVLGAGALVAFTPLAVLWFHNISGLSLELASFAYLPTQILVLLPALTVLISVQRSILVNVKKTSPISMATAIEVVTILTLLYITINRLNFVGVTAAACAYTIGRLLANLYLLPHQSRALR
ncbi:MAG: hypothetical protein GY950_16345 [bacterium]|nr:hypothetical protein [bacterium]